MRHEELADLSFTEEELGAIRAAEASGMPLPFPDRKATRKIGSRVRNLLRWLRVLTFLAVYAYLFFRLWRF